jgi:SecD/SecF fusion protein
MKRIILLSVAAAIGMLGLFVAAFFLVSSQAHASLSRRPAHGMDLLLEVSLLAAHSGSVAPMDQLKDALQKRTRRLGTRMHWEPVSETRVWIALPLTNAEQREIARGVITRSGILDFRLVHAQSDELVARGSLAPGHEELHQTVRRGDGKNSIVRLLVEKESAGGLTSRYVKQALVVRDTLTDIPQINFTLDSKGSAIFAEVTRENIGRRMAIVLDGELITAPVINSQIPGGRAVISGNFTVREAHEIAAILETPLPFPVKLIEERQF